MQLAIQSYFQKVKAVILNPKVFFDGVSETEGFTPPTIFILINTILTIFISFLFSLLTSPILPKDKSLLGTTFTSPFSIVFGLLVVIPLMLLILFITTVVLHLIAKILGGKGRFLNTYQAIAYSSAISPATAIPLIGFLASFYQIYITIVGFKKFHQYSTVKAVLNVLLPVIMIVIIIGLALLVLGFTLIRSLKGSGLKPPSLKNLENLQKIQTPQDLEKYYPTFAPSEESENSDIEESIE